MTWGTVFAMFMIPRSRPALAKSGSTCADRAWPADADHAVPGPEREGGDDGYGPGADGGEHEPGDGHRRDGVHDEYPVATRPVGEASRGYRRERGGDRRDGHQDELASPGFL
jgi:hypothetical protein